MMDFRRFTPGAPVLANDQALQQRHGVLFLFDENGNEWYQCQKLFSANTLKFAYDTNGIIRSIAKDVSMLWPDGLSVAEVDIDDHDVSIDISGSWLYLDGVVVKNESTHLYDSKEHFEEARDELLDITLRKITPLHVKLLLKKSLTKEESDVLLQLIDYMDKLNTMVSDNFKMLKLPELPFS